MPQHRKTRAPTPIDVRAIRRKLGLTQAAFAGGFGISVATLRHWERGNRRPAATALVLLHVIAHSPRTVLVAVRKARRDFPDLFPRWELSVSLRASPGEEKIPVY